MIHTLHKTKGTLYILTGLLFILLSNLQAQPLCGTNMGALNPAPGPTWSTLTECSGGYYSFPTTTGCTYEFTYCQGGGSYSGDPWLTITNQPNTGVVIDNDDWCGLGSDIVTNALPSGTHYIHIANWPSGCGGYCRTLAYRVTCPTPPTPPAPTAGANPSCGPTFLNIMNPPAGFTYYWQGTNPSGTSTANPTSATYPVTTSGTYYVRTQNNTNLSWSTTSSSITVTILPVPAPPPAPTAVQNPACNQTNLNTILNPPAGVTYYWQGTTPNGVSTTSPTSSVYPVTTSGTYYVRAQDSGGCWSNQDSIIITIMPPPSAPNIAANNPACISQTLSLSATGTGISYIWAGPNGFTSTDSVANIFNVNVFHAGVYSVNAIALGCTSAVASTINITVNPVPAAPNASSNAPICENGTLNLFATVVAGASYYWSGPSGYNANVQNATISPAMPTNSGIYSVVSIANGCSSQVVTLPVVVNAIPAAPVLSSNTPVCTGNTMFLSANGPTGTYTWTGPNGFNSNTQNPVIGNVTLAATGIYSAFVVVSGCSSAVATLPVNVVSGPGTLSPSSNTPVCEGQALNLSSTLAPGTTTYYWTGPNNYTSDQQEPVIMPTTLGHSGTYTLYAMENGCLGAGTTHNVAIQPAPVIPSVGSNSPICSGSNLNVTAATVAGATYNWTGPNGFIANTQNVSIPNADITNEGMYTVYVTINGCISLGDSVLTVVNQSPPIPFGSVNTPACTGDIINFSAADATPATYYWTGPYGFSSTEQFPFIGTASLTDNGNYNLYTIENGCTSAVYVLPLVVSSTPPTPVVSANYPVCGTTTLNLNTATIPGAIYSWSGPNGYISNMQNPSIPNVTQLNTGVYSLYLTVNGCESGIDTISINVIDVPLGVSAFSNSPICVGEDLHLSMTGLPQGQFYWTGPNGFYSTQQNIILDPAFLPRSGLYRVMYSGSGCLVVLSSVNVVVNPLPTQPIITFTGGFLNSNMNTNIQWSFNNVPISGATLPSLNPSLNGYYTVTYTDPYTGCPSTSQAYFYMNIFVGAEQDASAASVFTLYPNPVTSMLNIRLDLPFTQEDAILELRDNLGKVIHSENFRLVRKMDLQLNMENYSSGIYFINIYGSKMMLSGKIIRN